jgi:uncharacterized protein (DUF1778 family)
MKANIKHHTVIEKHVSHQSELMKILKEERASNERLKRIISMKKTEIDELDKKNTDLLWEAAKIQKENITLKNEIKQDELKAAQVQKSMKKLFDNESIDN